MKLGARDIASATGGWVERLSDAVATGISTDSRTLREGDVFFALRGPNFDGHRFLKEAAAAGAAGLVAAEGAGLDAELMEAMGGSRAPFVIRVPDTLRALGDLAADMRRRFTGRVVAVTGSNGKSTVKEMTAAILAGRWKTARSPGNFNNLIGVPLTVFSLEDDHQALVVEAGMNHPGEIGRITDIVSPDVGVVTSIGQAHLEHLGDIQGIREAKGEMLEHMKGTATAVLNADDANVASLAGRFGGRTVTFGLRQGADTRAERIVAGVRGGTSFDLVTPVGRTRITLAFIGLHNVYNALAAGAAAMSLGMGPEDVRAGLARSRPLPMRLEPVELPRKLLVINDAYNANPESVRAAVEAFLLLPSRGRRFVLLGDMLELGRESGRLHEETGRWMAERGVDLLVTVGREAEAAGRAFSSAAVAGSRTRHAAGPREAADTLFRELKPGDLLLVKASRGMALERAVEALRELAAAAPERE